MITVCCAAVADLVPNDFLRCASSCLVLIRLSRSKSNLKMARLGGTEFQLVITLFSLIFGGFACMKISFFYCCIHGCIPFFGYHCNLLFASLDVGTESFLCFFHGLVRHAFHHLLFLFSIFPCALQQILCRCVSANY